MTGVGDNLLTFLANRLSMSFTNLGCQAFGLKNPVTVTLNGAGAAVAATFNTAQQKAGAATGAGGNGTAGSGTAGSGGTTTTTPTGGHRKGRSHHQFDNPSGM